MVIISVLLAFSVFGCVQEEAVNGDPVGQEDDIFIVARGTDAVTLDTNWAYYEGE